MADLGKKPSWGRTLAIQAALCLALYAAFNIGRPQALRDARLQSILRRKSLDLYFLSVRGGLRSPREQAQLLHKMERAAKIYKAKFVVNIGELGEDDPLLRNVMYTTPVSQGQVNGNFLKKIRIAHGQILDIIAVDTGPLKNLSHVEQISKIGSDQLHWIKRTLAATNSNWRMVIGFDPLIVCEEKLVKFYEPLHRIFLEFGVNAYLSKQGCAGSYYHDEGIGYIGNAGPADEAHGTFSANGNFKLFSEMHNGFLLHRVNPLEIVGTIGY
ncbi:putative Ribonuclease H domain [Cocos nucifera]|uniref:Putative Ribonuclease H domain n=1 Tax=Cocos nucifera TaxID=13894 RepID=A0A8K0HU17_COCNU|nr:putative Ribonuclease H domain [Cocos nucifera]